MIDLLELIYDGKISFNEAYAVQDAHTSSFHFGDVDVSDWLAAFGLSKDVLKFTELEVVVRLHYEGWPKTCAQCKLPLNHKTERWLDVSRPEGEICLIHSSCWVEWVKRRWKSAVDALNRVGIQADQIWTLLGDSPRKLSESTEESAHGTFVSDIMTDCSKEEQPQRWQTIDLITLLHERKITPNEAFDIFDNATSQIPIAEGDPEHWAAPLGLSRYEARAITHMAGLEEVMHFRYQGWPSICADCKTPLDYLTDEWRCDVDCEGSFCLLHTDCWLGDGPMQRNWYFAVHVLKNAGVEAEKIRAVLGNSVPKTIR